MLLVTCRACGVVGPREMFKGKISEGLRRSKVAAPGRPAGQCKPCIAAYKRAARRKRPIETLSKQSLTKMGMKPPEREFNQAEIDARKEAREAWREWINYRAPRWWIDAYWAAGGRPAWNNPRLTEAERYRFRYATDMEFRCAQRLRLRIKKKLRRDDVAAAIRDAALGKRPAKPLMRRLGYTAGQLKAHVERQFVGRMSWQAFAEGKIHIDHIRPLSAFDLSDDGQFREAFSLPNMRPLWARDNLAKGASVLHLL